MNRKLHTADPQVKISDFGLSRVGETYQMNPKNKVSFLIAATRETYA